MKFNHIQYNSFDGMSSEWFGHSIIDLSIIFSDRIVE